MDRHPRNGTFDAARRVLVGAAATFAGVMNAGCQPQAPPPPRPHTTGPAPVQLPDTNYPVPAANVLHVALTGSDTNPGSAAAPLRHISRAFGASTTGTTIVVHGGVYREATEWIGHRITVQPAPHESVWISGADPVSGWVRDTTSIAGTTVWRHDNWTVNFCASGLSSCYNPGIIDPAHPAAGLPDLLFFDGRPFEQVVSLSAITAGRFYVDHTRKSLFVGSDPANHAVEASTREVAMKIYGPGSVIRGIGVTSFSPHWNNDKHQMVVSGASNVVWENDVFAHSAVAGLGVYGQPGARASGVVVRNSRFVNNGFQGLNAWQTDGLLIEGSAFTYNNAEQFDHGPNELAGASGAKISTATNTTVRTSLFDRNIGNGLWFDVQCSNSFAVGNNIYDNVGSGLDYEISHTAFFGSNVIVGNGGGIHVSNADGVSIINNTLAENYAPLRILDDRRVENTAGTKIINNMIWGAAPSSAGTNPEALSYVRDYSSPPRGARQMVAESDYNAYWRSSPAVPGSLAVWYLPALTRYAGIAQFRSGTGSEVHGWETVGAVASPFVNAPAGDYRLVTGSPYIRAGKALLPAEAALLGVAADARPSIGVLPWPAPPTRTASWLGVGLSPQTVVQGGGVQATALVGGDQPTGTVTIVTIDAHVVGSGTLSAGIVRVTFLTGTLTPGSHQIVAIYSGDAHNTASESPPVTLQVTSR